MQFGLPALRNRKTQYVLDYSKADFNGLSDYLLQLDFSDCFHSDDVEYVWAIVRQSILRAMLLYIPKVRLKSQQTPQWFNSEIRHLLQCVSTLRRKYNSCPSPHNLFKLNHKEEVLQQALRTSKAAFEDNLIRSCSPNKIYSYIRRISSHKSIPSLIASDNSVAVSDKDKAESFNRYFHSVFTKSSFSLPPLHELPQARSTLSDISISVDDVYQSLTSLHPRKAMGIDGIGPSVLKHSALALCGPLHHLFMLSLSQSYIPEEWRTHLVTPILKSGDASSVTNYRPISLLCCISKVLERIVFVKTIDFITERICSAQFGFLQKHSTLHQLLLFLDNILNSFKESVQTDAIYLDFRKAFDSVAHNELLTKLWCFGITGNLWKWFRAYLSSRTQCVRLNSAISDPLPVVSGVPQGSILGPILFLIFINDLPETLSSSHMLLFADDTKCFKAIHNRLDSHLLQQDLNHLTMWSQQWHLCFNPKKCVLVRFSPSPHSSITNDYLINDLPISNQNLYRDLGVILTSNLSWNEHYKHFLSNAYRILSLIRRIFITTHCPQNKRTLYLLLVRSRLMYCSPVWRPQFIKDIKVIERVQRRATKFILDDYGSDYKGHLTSLNMLPLMMQFELNDIIFFVSSLKNPTASFNIRNHVIFCSSTTRSSYALKPQHPKSPSNLSRHFFFNRLPRLWNSLPIIDLSLSVSSIKKLLRHFFWDHFVHNFHPDNPCTYHFICPCSRCSSSPIITNFSTLHNTGH